MLFPLPRRNRVAPTGEIMGFEARGRAMGNRGPLLNDKGEIVRPYKYKRWICCTLREVNGRKVRLDDPDAYTPLFFTDEAVAVAAGHRPCGSCRPRAFYHWLAIYKVLTNISKYERITSSRMDRDLHEQRAMQRRWPPTIEVENLPNGAFIRLPQFGRCSLLFYEGRLWPWYSGAYGAPILIDRSIARAEALTFPNIQFLLAGYRFDPELAPSPSSQ